MHQTYYAIFEARVLYWAGLDYKVARGVIGGRRIIRDGDAKGPYYRYNIVEKQTYLSAYHLSPKTVENYVEGIKKHKVKYLTGYASANYFLARFIEEAGIEPPRIKAVLTSADKLTEEMRETFRRVYGCEAFDSYNGVEATCLISECEHHRLHIVPDVGILEVLNDRGEPCKPGETGEAVTTGLLNFDQPLIRYRMGDLIRLAEDQTCKCGRPMPVVDEIVGRVEDTVVGPDGREMVRFHGIFYNIPAIIEGQVIQHPHNDFELKVVVSRALTEEEYFLLIKRMLSQLGKVNVEVNVVDSIPRSANGKFKAVISMVARKPAYPSNHISSN
jgi:phenylacetate-CoA ligase